MRSSRGSGGGRVSSRGSGGVGRARSAAQLSRRPSSACSVANSTWSEAGSSAPYPQGAFPGALPQNTGGLRSVTLLDIEQVARAGESRTPQATKKVTAANADDDHFADVAIDDELLPS